MKKLNIARNCAKYFLELPLASKAFCRTQQICKSFLSIGVTYFQRFKTMKKSLKSVHAFINNKSFAKNQILSGQSLFAYGGVSETDPIFMIIKLSFHEFESYRSIVHKLHVLFLQIKINRYIHIIAVVRSFVRKSVSEPFLEKCNNSKIVTILKL